MFASIKYVIHEPVYAANSTTILYYHTTHLRRTVKAKDLSAALRKFSDSIAKKYGPVTAKLLEYDQIYTRPDVLPEDQTWHLCGRQEIDAAHTFA